MADLAILGGKALFPGEPVAPWAGWPMRDEETAEALKKVYMSGEWSFNSPSEQAFEQAFADFCGAKYGIFMANGTTTLECALYALGVKPGDEVIVPALTWVATALAATYVGAVPVFVDIERSTLCMDPVKLEQAITPKTRAIIPVHLYGSMADLEKILRIADAHGIPVIEDCAHMHGGVWNGRGAGSWGKVGSFSFQQSKTMASGEGGICITSDPELAEKLYLLKHIGYARNVPQGQAVKAPEGLVCRNYRATAFQAVILHEQLKKFPARVKACAENAAYLTGLVKDIPGLRVQSPGRLADPQGYYFFYLIFDGEPFRDIPKAVLNDIFKAEGVDLSSGSYGPVYRHALFNLDQAKGQYRIDGGSCPVCESAGAFMHGITHCRLSDRAFLENVSAVLHKVAANIDEVRQYAESADAAK